MGFAGNYRSSTRMEMGDSCHIMTMSVVISAAPTFVLDPDYVEAAEGESPTIHFTATSDPPLAEYAMTYSPSSLRFPPQKQIELLLTFTRSEETTLPTLETTCLSSSNAVGKGQGRFSLKVRSKLQHYILYIYWVPKFEVQD